MPASLGIEHDRKSISLTPYSEKYTPRIPAGNRLCRIGCAPPVVIIFRLMKRPGRNDYLFPINLNHHRRVAYLQHPDMRHRAVMRPTAGHASCGGIAIMPVAMHGQQNQANQKAEPEHAASLHIALTVMPPIVLPLVWVYPYHVDITISSASVFLT